MRDKDGKWVGMKNHCTCEREGPVTIWKEQCPVHGNDSENMIDVVDTAGTVVNRLHQVTGDMVQHFMPHHDNRSPLEKARDHLEEAKKELQNVHEDQTRYACMTLVWCIESVLDLLEIRSVP